MADLRPLIAYIIDQTQDKGGSLGKTALIKLLYLADVEHQRHYGKRLTDLKWQFYHYGPYAAELEQTLKALGFNVDDEKFFANAGAKAVSGYRYASRGDWKEIESKFNTQFGQAAKRTVDRVVETWGLEPLSAILDYVYFETEPMQGAKRGEYLDFSKIQREAAAVQPTAKLSLNSKGVSDIRQRLERRKGTTPSAARKATEPVYDEVYIEACKIMDEEEGHAPAIKSHTKARGPVQE